MMGSVVGYAMIRAIAAGIAKSGSVDTEKMADGYKARLWKARLQITRLQPYEHNGSLRQRAQKRYRPSDPGL